MTMGWLQVKSLVIFLALISFQVFAAEECDRICIYKKAMNLLKADKSLLAIKELKKSAEADYVPAIAMLCSIYFTGKYAEPDHSDNNGWCASSAKSGDIEANLLAGQAQENNGNYEKAVEYYAKAAKRENAAGQYFLAQAYLTGRGVEKNYEKAFELFQSLAHKGDMRAQFFMGYFYETGKGVERSLNKAVEWYKMSADKNHPPAVASLAYFYRYGEAEPYIKKEPKRARNLYASIADKYILAQLNLGEMFETGEGGEIDKLQAVSLYKKAALQGSDEANQRLAEIYSLGEGVSVDYVKAVAFYSMSQQADGGFSKYMISVVKGLDKAQREKVEKLLKNPSLLYE